MSTRSMSSRRKRATARRNVQPQRPAIPRPEQRQPDPNAAEGSAHQTTPTAQPRDTAHPVEQEQASRSIRQADAGAYDGRHDGHSAERTDKWARSDQHAHELPPRLVITDAGPDDYFEQRFSAAARHGSGFGWREREWRSSGWLRRARVLPSIVVLLVIVALAGGFAYVLASRAALSTQNSAAPKAAAAPQSGVLVQGAPAGLTPTPQIPPYEIGIWVNNPTPGTGGVEQVFVRISHQVAAVVGAPVTLSVQFANGTQTLGPTPTGQDGVVTFNVSYGFAAPGQPVFVTASATEGGQTLTAQTTFFPA